MSTSRYLRGILFPLALLAIFALPCQAGTATMAVTSMNGCVMNPDRGFIGITILNLSIGGDLIQSGTTTRATLNDIKVIKSLDECTVRLFDVYTKATRLKEVIVRIYDNAKTETIRITLTDVIVTGIDYGPAQEGISFSCVRLEIRHLPSGTIAHYDAKGKV
ncbi:MAG: type VI secretion system tube protein Hcp [Acidobacteria bacterium]|nr:type VI secretion system tube protein Hcp [Acidobacteriota bacterium]